MADLNVAGRDRGQILLIAGLALGVTFVALALIVNSAIFTENLASRGETTGGDQIIEYRDGLERGLGTILEYTNENATTSDDHAALESRLDTAIGDTDQVMARHRAKTGATSEVRPVGYTHGSRIAQDAESDFTNASSETAWTLTTDADNARAFRFNVTRSALPSCTLFSNCFTVELTDGSETVRVSMRDTASGIEVAVDDDGTAASCDLVDEAWTTVDIGAGTVDGSECDALADATAPSGPTDITYRNGDQASGTYEVTVDKSVTADGNFSSAADQPTVTDALYDVTVTYNYVTSDVTYDSDLRVAPGEFDD